MNKTTTVIAMKMENDPPAIIKKVKEIATMNNKPQVLKLLIIRLNLPSSIITSHWGSFNISSKRTSSDLEEGCSVV